MYFLVTEYYASYIYISNSESPSFSRLYNHPGLRQNGSFTGMDVRLKYPFTALVVGPTGCGKTQFVTKLIKNHAKLVGQTFRGRLFGVMENIRRVMPIWRAICIMWNLSRAFLHRSVYQGFSSPQPFRGPNKSEFVF